MVSSAGVHCVLVVTNDALHFFFKSTCSFSGVRNFFELHDFYFKITIHSTMVIFGKVNIA